MLSISTFILTVLLSTIITAFLAWHARNFLGNPSPKERKLSSELAETKAELDSYKQNINNHFEKTASLFNDLSKQYRNLYEHLKTSSKELCGNEYQVNLLQYNSEHSNSIESAVDTKNIMHNWHPTYFEARDAKNSNIDIEIETEELKNTDPDSKSNSKSNPTQNSKEQAANLVDNLDINEDRDLLADLDKLDDLDRLNELNSLGNLDDLDKMTYSTNDNKSKFKDKIKIIIGKKKEQDSTSKLKDHIQTEKTEKTENLDNI